MPWRDDRSLTRWRERRMTRAHAVLWGIILVTTVGDVVLTMADFGAAGLWVVKFVAMCWLVAGWALLSERNATVFLGLFAVVSTAVVAYNAVVIAASLL